MNNGISIREFGRREPCSDTLVRRAIKEGRLKTYDDGTIDPSLVGTDWRRGNLKGANTLAEGANKGANKGANTANPVFAPEPAVDVAGQAEHDAAMAAEAEHLIESGVVSLLSYGEADQKKENYIALLRQLEYEEKAGALAPLDLAERVLFEGARAMRDAWLNPDPNNLEALYAILDDRARPYYEHRLDAAAQSDPLYMPGYVPVPLRR